MAPISKSLALAGALFAASGAALPVNNKRANVVVWETVTDVVWTTVDITKTIYAGAEPTPLTTTVDVVSVSVTPTPSSSSTPSNTPSKLASETPSTEPIATPTVAPTPTAVPPPPPEQPSPPPAPTTTVAPLPLPPVIPQPEPTTQTPNPPSPPPKNPSPPSDPSPSPNPPAHQGACSKSSPCSGDVTFYDTATTSTNPSSCGTTNDGSSENVLALPVGLMGEGDCGKTVTVKYGGNTVTGTVVDKCMGCDSSSIDLSRHFFGSLADFAEGRLSNVEWWIN